MTYFSAAVWLLIAMDIERAFMHSQTWEPACPVHPPLRLSNAVSLHISLNTWANSFSCGKSAEAWLPEPQADDNFEPHAQEFLGSEKRSAIGLWEIPWLHGLGPPEFTLPKSTPLQNLEDCCR